MPDQYTQEELEGFKTAFAQFDKDGNGKIDANELGGVMKSLNMTVSDLEVKKMIREVDADGSGSIDFEEFLNILPRSVSSDDTENELLEAFKVFDRNSDGTISADELREVMNNLGENLTEDQLEAMVREADSNHDGVINYEEFMKMMF